MNARFWICVNDDLVKITVPQDAELHWHRGGPDEEGWSLERHTWRNEGHVVTWEISASWLDCDGRGSSETHALCDIDKLDHFYSGYEDAEGAIMIPQWEWRTGTVRDFTAEAAGY